MENIVIKLVVDGNAKEATNQLDKLSDKEKEVKKNFDAIAASAKKAGQETKKAGKEAENGLDKLNGTLDNLKTAVVGAFAVESIIAFGKASVTAFAEAEQSSRKLEFAVKNIANGSDGALDLLMKQAEDLKAVSIFDDDDIIAAQNALITYGLTTDQVSKLIPKIVDLASATGEDLGQATDRVVSAINGQTRGLKDVGLQFKDTGDKVENYNVILDKLNKFQGATADATDTTSGALKRFQVAVGDISENTGELLVGLADGFAFMWDVAINGGEETRKQIKLTEEELKVMQEQMIKLGWASDLQALNETQLAELRKVNLQQLNELRKKYAFDDINIENTVGKFQADRIAAIDKEIERRKQLKVEVDKQNKSYEDEANATKRIKGAYEELTSAISEYNTKLLNQLTLTGKMNKEDLIQFQMLQNRKKQIDDALAATKRPTERMQSIDIVKKQTDEINKQNKEVKELQKSNQQLVDTEEDYQKLLQQRTAIIVESVNLAGTLSNIYFEQQLSQVQQERDARLRAIEDEKNARINQAGITNKKRLEYERQYEQEKQQVLQASFEQEKKWKKQQAVINGALAITNILATTPDPTGVYTALRIAGAIATTAAQVAQIDAQKFEKGGWIGGKRHREGGTLIEAEKDEFVVNRNDAQKNKDLLTNLNKGLGEKYIYENFVRPAIIRNSIGEISQKGLAENIANSLKYQMYDDHYLRKTFKQSTMQSAEYIVANLKSNQKPSRYV